jgi:heptosyltransferase-2
VTQPGKVPPGKVLIVQTAYLGDTVFTSALVSSLARLWPEARFEMCVAPRGRDVALAMPDVSQVHVFEKRGKDKTARGLMRMAQLLKERAYDLAVLPHRSLRTALLAKLAGIQRRVGFSGTVGSLFYTERVSTKARGFLEREGALALHFGARPGPMMLQPQPECLEAARGALGPALREPLAAICLGSEWETKIWPDSRTSQLVRTLRERGYRPVLLGGPQERASAHAVGAAGGCIDTTGNPIGEALAILSFCAVAVGGDTGLVHAARALGVPTVTLFGPTASDVHQLGPRDRAVSLNLDCSPCSAHGSHRCPLGHHRCMRDLEPGLVAVACMQVMAR